MRRLASQYQTAFVAVCVVVAAMGGRAEEPTTTPRERPANWAQRIEMKGVPNLHKVIVPGSGKRIMELRRKYGNDGEALALLDQLAREPEMHRSHSGYYAYEFFVACRPATT